MYGVCALKRSSDRALVPKNLYCIKNGQIIDQKLLTRGVNITGVCKRKPILLMRIICPFLLLVLKQILLPIISMFINVQLPNSDSIYYVDQKVILNFTHIYILLQRKLVAETVQKKLWIGNVEVMANGEEICAFSTKQTVT